MLECAVQFAVRGRPRRRGAAAAHQPRHPPRRQQQRHPPSRWAFSCFFFRIKKNIFLDLAVSSPHFYSAPLCSYEKKTLQLEYYLVLPSFTQFSTEIAVFKSTAPPPHHFIQSNCARMRILVNCKRFLTSVGMGMPMRAMKTPRRRGFFFLFFLFVFLLAVDFFFIGRHVMVSRRMNISMETP